MKLKDERKLEIVTRIIGVYYCTKDGRSEFNQEDVNKACRDIRSLGISDLKFEGNTLTIKLTRPGLLIGKRGENIDKLKKYLSDKYEKDIKICIVEDTLLELLYPIYFDEDYFNR